MQPKKLVDLDEGEGREEGREGWKNRGVSRVKEEEEEDEEENKCKDQS